MSHSTGVFSAEIVASAAELTSVVTENLSLPDQPQHVETRKLHSEIIDVNINSDTTPTTPVSHSADKTKNQKRLYNELRLDKVIADMQGGMSTRSAAMKWDIGCQDMLCVNMHILLRIIL